MPRNHRAPPRELPQRTDLARPARRGPSSFFIFALIFVLPAAPARAQSIDAVIADMEKKVAAEPRQNQDGLHALYRELNDHQGILAFRKLRSRRKMLAVVTDKSKDWRLRTILASCLQYDASKSVAAPLLAIVKDETERPEVRGGAASGLADSSVKYAEVCRELNQQAVRPGMQEAVLDGIMFSLQDCGCDDPEAMFSLMRSTRSGLNGIGINFNAVRCLRTSKHPKALEYLAGVIVKESAGSLLRGVALDQMLLLAQNEPERFRAVSDRLIEPLITMTYSEEYGGGNINVAIQLLGKARATGAVNRLIELLNHSEVTVCAYSVEALDEIGDPRALPALLTVWKNIPHDARSNHRWRYWYQRWKQHPRDPVVSSLVHAIKSMGGKLDPPEHKL